MGKQGESDSGVGRRFGCTQEGMLGERNESLLRLFAESEKAGGDLTRGGRTGRVWRSRAGMERAYGE